MKVTLIDYTGKGSVDPLYAARVLCYAKATRLEQSAATRAAFEEMAPEKIEEQLSEIANTIRSSWEFVNFTFQIEGVTRAFTHQLVRTRTASFAQQAQRVVVLHDLQILRPETVQSNNRANYFWGLAEEAIGRAYRECILEGIPAQDARGILPTNVLTNIVASFNLRTFADIVAKRLNARVQDEYRNVVRGMVEEAEGAMPWVLSFLFPQRTQTPATDAILSEFLGGRPPVSVPIANDALKEIDRLKGTWG